MKKCLLFLFSLFTLSLSTIYAQNSSSLSGKVTDENGEALSYANILLHAAVDSSMAKVEVSNEEGAYTFVNVLPGNYFISLSYVGLEDFNGEVFALSADQELKMLPINLRSADTKLDEVTVTAKRPMIEVRPDKVVFNIENSINATGNDALELLRKAPGVMLDNNENINLMGKSGVRVYINDRPSYLGPQDLAAYLKTINSDQIEAIEIITNPSARYDAEGNAGIINIRLKKNKNHGTNGTFALSASNTIDSLEGNLPKYGAEVSLNHRNKFINVYGRYGYNDHQRNRWENLDREQSNQFFDQQIASESESLSHSYKLGLDYFINKKQTIGFLFSGINSDNKNFGKSNTNIGQLADNELASILISSTDGAGPSSNMDANLNWQLKGENELVWNVDFDWGNFNNEQTNNYTNTYFAPNLETINPSTLNNDLQETDINILTGKIDHERNLGKGKLGIGVKTAIVKTENNFDFYNVVSGNSVYDPQRSNGFTYTENVNAVYATYDYKWDKWSAQLGLRIENSQTKGELEAAQVNNDKLVERNFTDYFPSGGLSYQASPKHQFQFAFGRRLDRPNYQNLNPFEYLINELAISKGDPFLRPQYTNNIQISHTFNYRFTTTLKYSVTEDLMTRFTDINRNVVDSLGNAVGEIFTWRNLDTQKHLSLNFSAPYSPTEWWSTYTSLSAYRIENEAQFEEGKSVDINANALNLYMQHTFSLPKEFSFEVSGWGNTSSIWGGNFETGPMWAINAGVQKKLFDGKAVLKVGVDDIFKSSEWSSESTVASNISGVQYVEGAGGWDSRRVKASFNYKFGNDKVKSRKRNTGADDEKKRAGS